MPQTSGAPKDAVGLVRHDHARCRRMALAAAEAACDDRRLRLTPLRRRVLEMLLESHHALAAYDMLDRLRAEGLGSQPPVIYRALEFLVQNGFAHRIERLNAFIACAHPDAEPGDTVAPHAPAFLICRACRRVAETQAPARPALADLAGGLGFAIERVVVEAEGLCAACLAAEAGA